MAFRQCFFVDIPEVTKIVLPKMLQNFKLSLLAQGTEPKRFFLFSAWHFFPKKSSLKGPLQYFWRFATEWMLKNPKGYPLSVFWDYGIFSQKKISPKGPQFTNAWTLWSPFAIFEPYIGHRLGPVPACFFIVFDCTKTFRVYYFYQGDFIPCLWKDNLFYCNFEFLQEFQWSNQYQRLNSIFGCKHACPRQDDLLVLSNEKFSY